MWRKSMHVSNMSVSIQPNHSHHCCVIVESWLIDLCIQQFHDSLCFPLSPLSFHLYFPLHPFPVCACVTFLFSFSLSCLSPSFFLCLFSIYIPPLLPLLACLPLSVSPPLPPLFTPLPLLALWSLASYIV